MYGKLTGKICRVAVMAFAASVVVMGVALPSQAEVDVFTGNPIAEIVEKASPAVVNIDTETMVRQSLGPFGDDPFFREFFGEQFERFTRIIPMKGKGSGFIVSEDGYILTNNHVVADADKIEVTLADGTSYPAEIVGTDPTFDLAVIKIGAKGLPVLELGDSENVRVGEWVVAIGNPYGFESTVTVGVISAKDRSVRARNLNFDGFLQTDAAINPGNSGGPLLNLDGEVIGINTAIIPYAQGIGFAVPVNMAKQVLDDLVKYGTVKRGWLGVYIQPLTPEFAEAWPPPLLQLQIAVVFQGFFVEWEPEAKKRSLIGSGLDFPSGFVEFCYSEDQGEPESVAGSGTCVVGSPETVEAVTDFFRCHAPACILDFKNGLPAGSVGPGTNADRSAFWRVFDGIVKQVRGEPEKQGFPAVCRSRRKILFQELSLFPAARFASRDGVFGDNEKFHRFLGFDPAERVESGQLEQLPHQGLHALDVTCQFLELPHVVIALAFLEKRNFGDSLHDGERGPQLVARISGKLL